jgi:hypothetical protein
VASIVTGLLGSGHTVDVAAGNRAAERQNIGDDGHSRQQPLQARLPVVEPNADWHTMDHFGEIAGGVVRRRKCELRTTRRRDPLGAAVQFFVRKLSTVMSTGWCPVPA